MEMDAHFEELFLQHSEYQPNIYTYISSLWVRNKICLPDTKIYIRFYSNTLELCEILAVNLGTKR